MALRHYRFGFNVPFRAVRFKAKATPAALEECGEKTPLQVNDPALVLPARKPKVCSSNVPATTPYIRLASRVPFRHNALSHSHRAPRVRYICKHIVTKTGRKPCAEEQSRRGPVVNSTILDTLARACETPRQNGSVRRLSSETGHLDISLVILLEPLIRRRKRWRDRHKGP